MAFNRPTLEQLKVRIQNDIKGTLDITALVRRSFLDVFGKVLAGLSHVLFGFLVFIEKQAFPDTATGAYLERWAAIWGVLRKLATFSQFQIDLTGTDGTTISATTIFKFGDFEYTVDSDVDVAGGVATVDLTSVLPGDEYNLELGDTLTIQAAQAGLDPQGIVSAITNQAEATESDDSLRARLIDRIQQPPSGGAANDYIQWAREIAGVTRAWVLPQHLGPGTVGVSFVRDADDPIIPDAAEIQEVFDYIETLRPVTANVTVFAPNVLTIDMEIALLPNTTEVQNAVIASLQDLILRDAALEGSFKSPGVINTGEILLSRINESISISQGEEDHNILTINTLTPANIQPATNELPVLGTITWSNL